MNKRRNKDDYNTYHAEVNGSPHAGIANTSLIIDTLRSTLALGVLNSRSSTWPILRPSTERAADFAWKRKSSVKGQTRIFIDHSWGELDGQKAFMEGQYKVEGDMSFLGRIGRMRSLFRS